MNGKLIAIAVVGVVLFLAVPFIVQVPKTAEVKATETGIETSAPRDAAPPAALPTMTRAQFSRIKTGMSLAQCVKIAGGNGEAGDANSSGAGGVTDAMTWYDPDGRTQFTFGFRNGRVASRSMGATPAAHARAKKRLREIRAQTRDIDLAEARQLEERAREAGQPVLITADAFEKISIGMVYDDCVEVIGAKETHAFGGGASATLRWQNPGEYYAVLTFERMRVTAKMWKYGPLE